MGGEPVAIEPVGALPQRHPGIVRQGDQVGGKGTAIAAPEAGHGDAGTRREFEPACQRAFVAVGPGKDGLGR